MEGNWYGEMSRILHPAYKHERAIGSANQNRGQRFHQPQDVRHADAETPPRKRQQQVINSTRSQTFKQTKRKTEPGFQCPHPQSPSLPCSLSFTLSSTHTHTLSLTLSQSLLLGPRSQSSSRPVLHTLCRAHALSTLSSVRRHFPTLPLSAKTSYSCLFLNDEPCTEPLCSLVLGEARLTFAFLGPSKCANPYCPWRGE